MKLLTVLAWNRSDAQAEQLYRWISGSGNRLHNKDLIHITLDRQAQAHAIGIYGKLPAFQLATDGPQLYEELSQSLAAYMIQVEEPRLLRRLIRDEFKYSEEIDICRILDYCKQLLDAPCTTELNEAGPEAYTRRRDKIAVEIAEFLESQTELNLDGFLRFRLHDYKQELRDVVEYAVDEFVMDRQYQEFISLLQYFVYIQEAKVPFVHLIHKGGNDFLLLDDQMEPIDTNDPDSVVTLELLESDMNFEDMIVSTLITVSPKKVYIHTREPNTQVIKTITQIFENRVELCSYCRLCQNLDRSTAAEYNKG
ncbi:putative sporulation protein YtxC [Paenibacillus sp. YYML68]|uniref:putative sporulation protein YtxC n=1 Tax=Paenibacillus sp. YYML68 TaxID=2909250 RepID=UPI00249387F7|nr:putative sporulation protein YtxC [Paenibacillus sp. YYML68]